MATSLFFVVTKANITGAAIKKYSYTKAICNGTNHCQDYEIICDGTKLIELRPITKATIQHANNWKDPRSNQTNEKLC